MFGNTAGEKIGGAIVGGILGDIISDELEDHDRTVVVHHRYESREVSYFEQLKCEIKQECRRIENSYSGNKFGAYSGLERCVRNAFYGHKISYFEEEELLGIIDSSRNLSSW